MTTATVQSLDEIMATSAASPAFKEALLAFAAGRSTPLIAHNHGSPHVKVLRVVTKLLEAEPALEVRSVEIKGTSGCSNFIGDISVNSGDCAFAFRWDCRWRAEQNRWRDGFGQPDQIRAAREFGYQCFSQFERVP
jgi:hypothetical protein